MKIKEKEEKEEVPSSPLPEKVLYDNRIKRKNVLALNEKVAAIREYEKLPVYKRIGRMFQCSPDQIKRIVQQKDAILKAWEQRTRRCQDARTLEMKVVRVSMLGKAVYDWIRRMMYYKDFMISDGLIQKMALQFKSAMGLQNFFPHQEWCDKFRQTYNISESDSSKLSIGYTQGYSVQIKDVMKDVLSECTPDVTAVNTTGDDEQRDENANERTQPSVQGENGGKGALARDKAKAAPTKAPNGRTTCQRQTIRQLVALPGRMGMGLGMTQKVLVATPITPPGQRAVASPMTMTIIPLTTIAKTQNPPPSGGVGGEKHGIPAPMVEIKREIKEEPLEAEAVRVKQEFVSDDEDGIEDVAPDALDEASNAPATALYTFFDSNQRSEHAVTLCTKTYDEDESSANDARDEELDSMDYDNLALSHLRKLIQNRDTSATPANPHKRSAPGFTVPALSRAPASSDVPALASMTQLLEQLPPMTPAPSMLTMPPMPPLTKAPVNRTANKRKHSADPPALSAIKTCGEARRYLKLLEDFALFRENYRLIGLITRADEVLRELDGNEDVDVD